MMRKRSVLFLVFMNFVVAISFYGCNGKQEQYATHFTASIDEVLLPASRWEPYSVIKHEDTAVWKIDFFPAHEHKVPVFVSYEDAQDPKSRYYTFVNGVPSFFNETTIIGNENIGVSYYFKKGVPFFKKKVDSRSRNTRQVGISLIDRLYILLQLGKIPDDVLEQVDWWQDNWMTMDLARHPGSIKVRFPSLSPDRTPASFMLDNPEFAAGLHALTRSYPEVYEGLIAWLSSVAEAEILPGRSGVIVRPVSPVVFDSWKTDDLVLAVDNLNGGIALGIALENDPARRFYLSAGYVEHMAIDALMERY